MLSQVGPGRQREGLKGASTASVSQTSYLKLRSWFSWAKAGLEKEQRDGRLSSPTAAPGHKALLQKDMGGRDCEAFSQLESGLQRNRTIFTHTFVYICVYICLCVYKYISIYVHVCMYMYTHTYTYTHTYIEGHGQPTPLSLPGESHGQEAGRLQSTGVTKDTRLEVDLDEM